jgi:hypothetical protein
MADENLDRSDPPSDPSVTDSDSDEEGSPPADDTYLLGATGVEEQVLADLARTEAKLHDPEEAADESDGAVV